MFTQASSSQWVFTAVLASRMHCREPPRLQGEVSWQGCHPGTSPALLGGSHCLLYLMSYFFLIYFLAFLKFRKLVSLRTMKALLSSCLKSNIAADRLMPICFFVCLLYYR